MHRMKLSRARFFLRCAAVCSSLVLLLGCAWFAHKQANPAVMPGSKSGTLIMSGSKSYNGGTTITSGALQNSKPLLPPVKP
jgi:autotransporter-associated beta strand protein